MSRILLTGPAGSGKTAYAVNEILEAKRHNPWQPVWVLLPTELQINAFRDRLRRDGVVFGVQYFTFYEFYRYLLNQMCLPQREIREGSVFRVLRHAIGDVRHDLEYFQPIVDKPGFVALVAEFIFELKQARVSPERFHAATPKDRDLARIYGAYQQWVREAGVIDREGAGWLALDRLPAQAPWLDVMLVVDGFQQFSPLQRQLMEALAERVQRTVLTLTYEEDRASTVHRVFARTLVMLEGPWERHELPAPPTETVLRYLERNLLRREAEVADAGGRLMMLEAPDAEQEVRGVLRHVKRLLLDGEAPEQIVILVHDMNRYADLLRSIGAAYGIPLVFRRGLQLARNPAVGMILKLLGLEELRRQDVIDILRSPYFETLPDVDILERLSLQFQVLQSRDDWMEAFERARRLREDEDGEIQAGVEVDDEQQQLLADFFERVVPPESATVAAYVAWIESLLGPDPEHEQVTNQSESPIRGLRFYERVREAEEVVIRDLYALQALRQCLKELVAAYELLGDPIITWQQFRTDLQLAIEQRRSEPEGAGYRSGQVLVTHLAEAMGLPHDHVLIMGLMEGVLPTLRQENALYSDLERKRFEAATGYELQTVDEQQDDVALFYQCLAMASETLTLSRSTLDDNANPWPASVLWRAVIDVVSGANVVRYRAGEAPGLNEAASMREAGVALAQAGHDGWEWFGHRWEAVKRGREIELRREDKYILFDQYAGVLRDDTLLGWVAQRLGANRVWSASQFNDYGYCPFRFFSKRLLKLDRLEEPAEGYDAAQLGLVQHEILELTYGQVQAEGLAIGAENVGRALEIMEAVADEVFQKAPRVYGFREPALWNLDQEGIRRRLRALIQLDFSDDPENPFAKARGAVGGVMEGKRYVYGLEAAFGIEGQDEAIIEGKAGPVRAKGLIDRIDRSGDGLVVIDYKSGSSPPGLKNLETMRNYQMMLYLLAAQQLVTRHEAGLRVRAGMFWSIRTRKAGAQITTDDGLLEALREQLHRNLIAARAGYFPVQPNQGKCFKYCEYTQLCRIQHTRGEG